MGWLFDGDLTNKTVIKDEKAGCLEMVKKESER
jgi:hypothetical protein